MHGAACAVLSALLTPGAWSMEPGTEHLVWFSELTSALHVSFCLMQHEKRRQGQLDFLEHSVCCILTGCLVTPQGHHDRGCWTFLHSQIARHKHKV